MDRRVLAALGLVALVTLAGCPRAPIDVSPDVDNVESDGDAHRVQVTVDPDLENTDENVSDVRVHGYTLDGERVCSAAFGDITDRGTRTLECETFPSLLVADTPDRGKAVETEGGSRFHAPPPLPIVTTASLYRGFGNGSHHFEVAESRLNRSNRFNLTGGRAVPTDEALQTMQCRQWRHRQAGRDFSALEDAPWLEWELRTHDGTQNYAIGVSNYSRHVRQGETDQLDLEPAGNTATESDVPTPLAMRIWRNDFGSESSHQRGFREVVDGLSSAEVNASENATAAMRGIPGRYGRSDDTRINCRDAPPRISGERGESVETFVVVDGYTYYVRLTRTERIAGNAFRNVTAP